MKRWLWLVVLLTGCTVDLTADEQSEITCQSDRECPSNAFCSVLIERCVLRERSDETAPAVVSSSISPTIVGPGDSIVFSFSTDESLRQAPTVTLFGETFVGETIADTTHRIELTVPDSGFSETLPVRVTVADAVGNAAEALLGEFVTDYDPPALTNFGWDDPAAAAVDSVVDFGGTTEADAQVVAARVVDDTGASIGLPELSATLDDSGAAAVLSVRGLVRVDSLPAQTDSFAVELDVIDPFGNQATVRGPAKAIDRSEPDTRLDTTPAAESTRLRASFTFSSPDDDVVAYECSLDGGDFVSCMSPYEERVGEGPHTFAVRAIDAIGFTDQTPATYAWNDTLRWGGPGTFSSDCAIASDGTLWCWDALAAGAQVSINQTQPVQVGDEADWLAVVSSNGTASNHIIGPSGSDNVCGIRGDGGRNSVWCWGLGIGVAGVFGSAFPVRALEDGFATVSLEVLNACGVKLDGSLWCWGDGSIGQLGNGSFANSNVMVRVGDANDWTHVSTDTDSSCGIRQQGTERNAYCWGQNTVGDPSLTPGVNLNTPTRVGSSSDWIDIASIQDRTCGIRAEGGNTLWCYGELNDDSFVVDPTQVGTDTGWVKLQASQFAFCGLQDDGSLWCWGDTSLGIMDGGDDVESDVPVRVSAANDWIDFSLNTRFGELCALNLAGELECRGGQSGDAFTYDLGGGELGFAPVDGSFRWSYLSVPNNLSDRTICGIAESTQQAYCWGRNDSGGMRLLDFFVFRPFPIDSGAWLGVRLDRSVVPTMFGFSGVTTGCGILDGNLRCWGRAFDPNYVFDDPTTELMPSGGWLSITSGNEGGQGETPSYCATRSDPAGATLWCWGENKSQQLGLGDTMDRTDPAQVGVSQAYEAGWEQLSQARQFVCGIRTETTDRQLYCWGSGSGGRLGNGSNGSESTPARVGTETDWLMVSATSDSACGLRGSAGSAELWCWGQGGSGELGDGLLQNYNVPTKIGAFDDWVHIESSPGRRCGTRADGTLWCWGNNTDGHPVPSDERDLLPEPTMVGVPGGAVDLFIVGNSHACAQTDQLYCWGESVNGLLGFGRLFGPVVSIAPPPP